MSTAVYRFRDTEVSVLIEGLRTVIENTVRNKDILERQAIVAVGEERIAFQSAAALALEKESELKMTMAKLTRHTAGVRT